MPRLPRFPLLLAVLLVAVAAAGCLAGSDAGGSAQPSAAGGGPGSGGPGAGPAAGPGSQGGDGTSSPGNGTSGNATDTAWRNQTRRGSFTGAKVFFGIFGRSESFPVPDGARNLTLVIRAPDVELTGSISPPCADGIGGCPSQGYETASGRYVYRQTTPQAGQWDVTFFRDRAGAGQQRYVLKIAREVPAAR